MSDTPQIKAIENGPLMLSGDVTFVGGDGVEAAPEEKRFLCRCGLSANKPFCDGSHKEAGFSSENPAGGTRDKLLSYEGADVTVYYSPFLCSHAAECGKRLKSVFNSKEKPWIQPDNGSVEDIMEVVRACPSGALQASKPGGRAAQEVGDAPRVAVEPDGPYRVEAVALSDGAFSDNASEEKYVLCRCGQSKNKPFCDGSHGAAGWQG